jgi:hypothetical protein
MSAAKRTIQPRPYLFAIGVTADIDALDRRTLKSAIAELRNRTAVFGDDSIRRPFLPVGRKDLDLPTGFGIHPNLPAKSAGEHKCVNRFAV